MAQRVRPTLHEMLSLMRLLADVAALKTDPPAQRQVLIDGLSKIIGADSAFLYVAEQWRVNKPSHFVHQTLASDSEMSFQRYALEFGRQFSLDADPFCYVSRRNRSKRMTLTLGRSLEMSDDPNRHRDFMDLKQATGFTDGVIAYYRPDQMPDRLVGFGLHHFGKGNALTPRQVAIVDFAVAELRRLVEHGHLVFPLPETSRELPVRLRQVLDRMLAGKQPKSIARELGLSVWTVREHVQRLYQHFGVSSRDELMSKFVGRPLDDNVG